MVGSIPKAAVRFAAFNELSNRMKGPDGKLSTTSTMLAGLGAGIFEAIIAGQFSGALMTAVVRARF